MRKSLLSFLVVTSCLSPVSFAYQANQSTASNHPLLLQQSDKVIKSHSNNLLDLTDLIGEHLAIAVRNPETGVISYTQHGIFLKKNGYYYQGGNRLQGFSIPNTLTADACTLSDVNVSSEMLPAKATSLVYLKANLNVNDFLVPSKIFNMNDPETYNFRSGFGVYDKSGNIHTGDIYFIKKSMFDLWTLQISVDDQLVASGEAAFNSSGVLASSTGLDQIKFTTKNDREPQTFKLDISSITQLGNPYITYEIQNDGYPNGDLIADEVDFNGYLSQRYTNFQAIVVAKIAVYTTTGAKA